MALCLQNCQQWEIRGNTHEASIRRDKKDYSSEGLLNLRYLLGSWRNSPRIFALVLASEGEVDSEWRWGKFRGKQSQDPRLALAQTYATLCIVFYKRGGVKNSEYFSSNKGEGRGSWFLKKLFAKTMRGSRGKTFNKLLKCSLIKTNTYWNIGDGSQKRKDKSKSIYFCLLGNYQEYIITCTRVDIIVTILNSHG